eukprot:CAMPEP_0170132498 /NCGR_PEP_ID=MMETSP0033_2-20121228/401_1 /TAXON_ID=195969 /ORGANISM="Dolichomastix tenuilepis, Strain CCMP3274" /LENGTH=571 /DNA_ID=CAMNT_0010367877 /DNA_START=21 /DNA_END=1736 /DNA_ORIENTATION=+
MQSLSSRTAVPRSFRAGARRTAKTAPRAAVAEVAAPVTKTDTPLKIVFISAEVAPWSKTGGLGDVVGSLPVELAKRGHKVMSIAPRYDQYRGAWDTEVQVNVQGKDCRLFHERKQGVDRVFIDNPLFLAKVWGKTGSKLYGKKSGHDYVDNQERFAMFNQAAIEAVKSLPFGYGEDVVFVANDWHSALIPAMLKKVYQQNGEFMNAKVAFCVHNIAFQGRFWPTPMEKLGLPSECSAGFAFMDGNEKVYSELTPAAEDEKAAKSMGSFDKINWMQGGFYYADKNITVSPNYATEVMSGPDKGVELDKILNKTGIEGIVNGMDVTEWNPMTDKFLDMPYDESSVVEGKAVAKMALQAEVGLEVDAEAPLFGYIGRLEEQKGVDILLAALKPFFAANPTAQVVILGTGKKSMEKVVEQLETKFPNARGVAKFSSPLAHYITAGADFLMVPSRFEPCGLIQLHAMQYGTVPVVASTGGLVDTVKEGVTGFHMGAMDPDGLEEADVAAMVTTMTEACGTYTNGGYAAMSAACISQDLSWAKPAKKWEGVLQALMLGTSEATETKKAEVVVPVAAI